MNLELLIATKNIGKIKEFKQLLADLPINLRSADEFENVIEPAETGHTFADNAVLKARYYAEQTSFMALADDSGLMVEALGGAPGIFSARYAGANATNDEKIGKLLNALDKTPDSARSARFICSMAIADKNGEILYLAEGLCRGRIARQAEGNRGFGYDPIFIPEGFSESFGQLSDEIKSKISHRALAVNKIIEFFRIFIAP